jgi:hypothetical protein
MGLWHVVHEDGDEEDLEETEVQEYIVRPTESMELSNEESNESKGDLSFISDEEDAEPEVIFRYTNNAPGGLSLRPNQVGLDGLKQEILRMEGRLVDGLKSKGSHFQKDVRKDWENSVRSADSVGKLKSSLIELEAAVRGVQVAPDVVDDISLRDKKEGMKKEGWIFYSDEGETVLQELEDQLESPAEGQSEEQIAREIGQVKNGIAVLGRKGRRFFPKHGKSDGTIVAFLRGGMNDGIALWHMEHDDGDCEDLDNKELERVLRYFESDVQEEDRDVEDEEVSEEENPTENLEDTDDEMSEEEDEEEEEEIQTGQLLWPSLSTRMKWVSAVQNSQTVSEIALALNSFLDYADRFGLTAPDPLDAYGTSLSLVSRRMWRESTSGGRESISRAPVKSNLRNTRSARGAAAGNETHQRRSSLKAAEGSRRVLRDRAAKKMVSYTE